jgi:hypothetical protein
MRWPRRGPRCSRVVKTATGSSRPRRRPHRSGRRLWYRGAGERWGTAADRFDRAARAPGGHPPEPGAAAGELRVLARSLLTARGRAGRDAIGGVALAVGVGRAGGRDRRLAGHPRPRPPGRCSPPGRGGRHRAHSGTHLPHGRARHGSRAGGNGRARGRPQPRAGSGRSRRRQNSEPTMTPPTATFPPPPSTLRPAAPAGPGTASPPASQPTLWADRL